MMKSIITLLVKMCYFCNVANRVIDTNEHIKLEQKRFDALFRSVYTSFEIEKIYLPIDEARKIAEEIRREVSAQNQKHLL